MKVLTWVVQTWTETQTDTQTDTQTHRQTCLKLLLITYPHTQMVITRSVPMETNGVFPKRRIQWQKLFFVRYIKGLEPAASCVRDQDATTAPARHMWETGSLTWAQFMLHWFINSLNSLISLNLMKVLLYLRKIPFFLCLIKNCSVAQKSLSVFDSVFEWPPVIIYVCLRVK